MAVSITVTISVQNTFATRLKNSIIMVQRISRIHFIITCTDSHAHEKSPVNNFETALIDSHIIINVSLIIGHITFITPTISSFTILKAILNIPFITSNTRVISFQ